MRTRGDGDFREFVLARWEPLLATAYLVTGDRGIADAGLSWRRRRRAAEVSLDVAGDPAARAELSGDLDSDLVLATGQVTTPGDLAAVRSAFTCDEGALNQWIFDEQVLWSLDGGPRMTRFVESATLATNR